MSDIIKDLMDPRYCGQEGLRRRAADEIKRQRAALKEIVDFEGEFSDRPSSAENSMRLIAERTINGESPATREET